MNLSDPIGGYFGLEIQQKGSYYNDLIALNSGRNAFEYILRARKCRHIYIPYYTCDVLLEPIHKLNIPYEFYSVNERLEPETLAGININSSFLYTNYFGLKSAYIKKLTAFLPNLIIDAAQAFFDLPLPGMDTFYSPRKFFGLPDGGYVSCDIKLPDDFEEDHSVDRVFHLVNRIDQSAEKGYAAFKISDASLCNQPIKKMSKFTIALLKGIDYPLCLNNRNENFRFLHSRLKDKNVFQWLNEESVNGPMIYPFYTVDKGLRKKLIENKIYVATYWPNIPGWVKEDSLEYNLNQYLLPLPIDHRYGKTEMEKIIAVING